MDPVRSTRVRQAPGQLARAMAGVSLRLAPGSAGVMARQGRTVLGLETSDIAGQPRGADMGAWAQGWVCRDTGGAELGCENSQVPDCSLPMQQSISSIN